MPTLTFLFWNIKKQPLEKTIANLVKHHNVDILMLAESKIHSGTLLQELNTQAATYHYSPNLGCTKIQLFTAFSNAFCMPFRDTDRLTIRHITLPARSEFLLAINHFQSKMHNDDEGQILEAAILNQFIRDAEKDIGHSKTVLVGDLNMNPFEAGMISGGGLNAVMTRDVAMRRTRTVSDREYPFFYNPMWGLFGDQTRGPAGTHYFNASKHRNVFWNMFDQVLFRPDLIESFDFNNLHILDKDGKNSFLTKHGLPDDNNASDHLPLLFSLNI